MASPRRRLRQSFRLGGVLFSFLGELHVFDVERVLVVQNFVQHDDGGTGNSHSGNGTQNTEQSFMVKSSLYKIGLRECYDIVLRLFGRLHRNGGQHRAFAAVDVVELVIDLGGHSDPGALLQCLVAS